MSCSRRGHKTLLLFLVLKESCIRLPGRHDARACGADVSLSWLRIVERVERKHTKIECWGNGRFVGLAQMDHHSCRLLSLSLACAHRSRHEETQEAPNNAGSVSWATWLFHRTIPFWCLVFCSRTDHGTGSAVPSVITNKDPIKPHGKTTWFCQPVWGFVCSKILYEHQLLQILRALRVG